MISNKIWFDSVSDMRQETNATVHGVVLELSPIKSSRNNPDMKYFNGSITDGTKVACMVCFEPKLRASLEKFRETGESVSLVNCKIREGKYEPGLEITTAAQTTVRSSSKKFEVDAKKLCEAGLCGGGSVILLNEVEAQSINRKVEITCKIMKIGETIEVQPKKATGASCAKPLIKQV